MLRNKHKKLLELWDAELDSEVVGSSNSSFFIDLGGRSPRRYIFKVTEEGITRVFRVNKQQRLRYTIAIKNLGTITYDNFTFAHLVNDDPRVSKILHRFKTLGESYETKVEYAQDDRSEIPVWYAHADLDEKGEDLAASEAEFKRIQLVLLRYYLNSVLALKNVNMEAAPPPLPRESDLDDQLEPPEWWDYNPNIL